MCGGGKGHMVTLGQSMWVNVLLGVYGKPVVMTKL